MASEVIALIILLSMAGMNTVKVSAIELRHTITVDGNPDDWTGTPPTSNNSYAISDGEYIWKDAINDERNEETTSTAVLMIQGWTSRNSG